MTTAEAWVSVEDGAAHLGVASDSVYRWIDGRRSSARKIGRLSKFKPSKVDTWVRAGGAKGSGLDAAHRLQANAKIGASSRGKS